MEKTILARTHGPVGRITISVATSSQPFDIDMLESLKRKLINWACDDAVEMVLIERSSSARDFCASEGAKALSLAARYIGNSATQYLDSYFQLCHLISTFPKPVVSILDGATVAEGTGLLLLASHQVATERASVAYPETSFGSIPNAAATRLLPALPGEIGTWMALTGARISGSDVCAIGLATHYCPSTQLPALLSDIQSEGVSALKNYTPQRGFTLQKYQSEMDFVFAGSCAKQIKCRLEKGSAWAKSQATKMSAKSPLSTRITLRLLRTGPYLDSSKEALILEYRVLSRLLASQNFREGVRAAFEDKDHWPNWKPDTIFKVTYDMVSEYFTPSQDRELLLIDAPKQIARAPAPRKAFA